MEADSEFDTISFRFQCQKGVEIRITPLIVPVAAKLDEDIVANVSVPIHIC